MNSKNPRNIHAGKNRLEKDDYQKFLKSPLEPDYQTEKAFSTKGTDSSTIEEEIPDTKFPSRPKTIKKSALNFIEDYGLKIVIVTVISLFGWLFLNDYNFNADIRVAENDIENIEDKIAEYKDSGIISKNDFHNFSLELEGIKNSYAKLDKLNDLEKNYKVLKTSVEKDIEYLREKISTLQLKN